MAPVDESQFFESVLRCVADGVFTVDTDWRITSFNPAAERITGVPAERAIGKQCCNVFHASICETGSVIVTAVTGYAGDPRGYEKFLSGRRLVPPPDAFFAKPLEPEQFVAEIGKLLNGASG